MSKILISVICLFSINSFASDIDIQIVNSFHEYRRTVKNGQDVYPFFTPQVINEWQGYIERSEQKDRKSTLEKIRSRASFGKWILKVYEFNIEGDTDTNKTLRIIYTSPKNTGPFTYEVKYQLIQDKWLISGTLSDTTEPPKGYQGTVIHDYK